MRVAAGALAAAVDYIFTMEPMLRSQEFNLQHARLSAVREAPVVLGGSVAAAAAVDMGTTKISMQGELEAPMVAVAAAVEIPMVAQGAQAELRQAHRAEPGSFLAAAAAAAVEPLARSVELPEDRRVRRQ